MNQPAKVLVVEDDATLRQALCDTIKFGGYQAVEASSGVDALSQLSQDCVDMVISDVQMDHMDGRELLRQIRVNNPELPFVMITAHGSVQGAVDAMREGATDYLLKPFEAEVLLDMVSRMEPLRSADAGDVIMADPETAKVYGLAQKVASNDASILISGESGCGKEVLAQYLHSHSNRVDKPFVAVNCAAIPENMLESMLFGYEKGAYTGAHQARAGKFEQANGGTILLDEISEMPLALQAKLLRVLQEKEYTPIGETQPHPFDAKIISASSISLEQASREGRFRDDLRYRLEVMPIALPPLKKRPEDIEPLFSFYLQQQFERHDQPVKPVEPEVYDLLIAHHWPGNVRELINVCIYIAALTAVTDPSIGTEKLPLSIRSPASRHSVHNNKEGGVFHPTITRQSLQQAMLEFGGRRDRMAAYFGISRMTLWRKMKRFGLL